MRTKSTVDRFLAKVERGEDGCWTWTACRDREGYGRFRVGDRIVQAHRFAFEEFIGPIPEGLVMDHLCRNTSCVNPAHLEPVTDQVNILRGQSLSATRAAQERCKWGHEFTPANTYLWTNARGNTARICRTCRARVQRRRVRAAT